MKVQRSVSMYSHAFERACKRQIVTDPKSGNVSRIYSYENNVPSWLLSQWLCGNSLGHMMHGYTLLVPMNQRVLNKLGKEDNISGHK